MRSSVTIKIQHANQASIVDINIRHLPVRTDTLTYIFLSRFDREGNQA